LETPDSIKERVKHLLEKEDWSEEDRLWLLEYLDSADTTALRLLMEERFREDAAKTREHPEASRLLSLIHEKISPERGRPKLFSIANWKKFAVAALLLLIAGKLVFTFTSRPTTIKTPATPPSSAVVVNDRQPGTNNATLTLADGRTITLDGAANGGLAQQGNTKVIKLNGQIAYTNTGAGQDTTAVLMNTIATARGNQYVLVLSDGSKVWLNAASSMRFPTTFRGKERRVEITGEAYFEIAKNTAMPFKVVAGGGEIEVLGTHFNVNAYNDESSVKTTVLEGAVAVKKAGARVTLSPGQQAGFSEGKETISLKEVDAGKETAWKDGYFSFDNTDIYTLMRQAARWYDVEVTFKGKVTEDGFSGRISRNMPLSKLLKVLEQYDLHFNIEGKHITIMP